MQELQDMRRDVELLGALLDSAPMVKDLVTDRTVPLSAKTVAHWTGRAVQTVSDYRIGKLNIPIDFWRSILEHHLDMRIVQLLVPDQFSVDVVDLGKFNLDTGIHFLRTLIESEQQHHTKQLHIITMLEDGRIDQLDARAVQEYDDAFALHRKHDAMLRRIILEMFQQAVADQAKRQARSNQP